MYVDECPCFMTHVVDLWLVHHCKIKMVNITYVYAPSLMVIPQNSATLFFYLILTVSIIAVIGNGSALRSIARRQIKYFQKVCIISLAMADILSVAVFATNHLEALSKDIKTWILGEFLCYFIPTAQVLGTTMSSFCLLAIALDRYQSLNSVVGKKWDPTLLKSIFLILILWIASTVASAPMVWLFNYFPVCLVYPPDKNNQTMLERADVCIATDKERFRVYYTSIASLVFFPLITMFSWFYYKIAMIIWEHRTPQTSIAAEPSTSKDSSSSSDSNTGACNKPNKVRNVQVERKIRTFKVIIVLLLTFVLCRLPYWVYFVIRLSKDISTDFGWNLNYAFIVLNLLNCALNPFLYTFLNQSITALEAIKQLISKLLSCCCFTISNSDLEEFEKYKQFEVNVGQNKEQNNDKQKNTMSPKKNDMIDVSM